MEHLLLIIIGILLLIIFVLLAKVYFLRKSAQEISEAFRDRLTADTNTLIDISTRDPYMRKLAADINVQLRQLRQQRHSAVNHSAEQRIHITQHNLFLHHNTPHHTKIFVHYYIIGLTKRKAPGTKPTLCTFLNSVFD